ncbi:MAG: hypothetical protein ACYDB2_07715 [Acidimicrobiales bacterium]
MNRKIGRGSLRSTARSLLAIGATSALLVTGFAFVAVSPASAAGAPNRLVYTTPPPSTTIAGNALASFSVSVEDNTPAVITSGPGATDTIAITSTSCTLTGTTSTPAVAGVATFNALTITTGTNCTLVASDTTTGGVTTATSASIAVTPAAAQKIAYTSGPPTAGVIGVSLAPFKVSIEDTYGNVITSGSGSVDTIAVATSSPGCTLAGTVTATASGGVATFSSVSFSAGTSCTLTATDTLSPDTSFAAITSGAINVVSNTPTELGFTTEPPTSISAGTVLPPFAVSVEASNGIPLSGGISATDVIVLTSACALSGTTTVAAVNNVATFTAVAIKNGTNCQLVATDTTRTLATATSTVVTLTAGAAGQVVFTTAPPTTEPTAGTILAAFKVSVEDVNGNVVTSGLGSTDLIAITSPCTLGGTTTASAFAGVATFSALSIGVTGTCVLTATDASRAIAVASHTTSVGTPQATLTIGTVKGNVGTSLNLATSGGSGTGAVTYTLAAGSSAGCTLTGTSLKAARAGNCVVTATKAGDTTYIATTSAATTVSFIVPFKVVRVAGVIVVGQTRTVTLVGTGFYARPRIISNVRGLTSRVVRDTGSHLVVVVSVKPGAPLGIRVLVVILGNGKRSLVRFNLR